jgi:hypothetical protein
MKRFCKCGHGENEHLDMGNHPAIPSGACWGIIEQGHIIFGKLATPAIYGFCSCMKFNYDDSKTSNIAG